MPNATVITTSAVVDITSVMLPTAYAVHTLRGMSHLLHDLQRHGIFGNFEVLLLIHFDVHHRNASLGSQA